MRDLRAMVLAAGLGTRLRPLTEVVPKPLLPILGVTVLDVTMTLLHEAGVRFLVMNLHHLGESMRAAALAAATRNELELRLLDEGELLLGTGGGVKNAAPWFEGADAILVVNGDTYFEADLKRVVDAHLHNGARATMLLRANPDPSAYAPVETDGGGRIRRIAGRPVAVETTPLSPWLFAGVHVLDPATLALLPDGPADINRTLYPTLITRGDVVRGETFTGPWFDLGTPRRLLDAARSTLEASEGTAFRLSRERGFRLVGDGGGRSIVARDANIDSGAVIAGSVIQSGAHVGPGAEVLGSILFAGATVGAHARLTGAIVAPGTSIAEAEGIHDAIAIDDRRVAFTPSG